MSKNVPFGTTVTGQDWCVKALHPSDPLTEVRGIPDHSAVPSMCMNYQTTRTLKIAQGAGPWDFDFTMLPHPLCLAYWSGVNALDPDTNTVGEGNFVNSQLAGINNPTHSLLFQAWTALAERWRLCYMSVTVYQDGPDLANQGTLVVSQAPFEPTVWYSSATTGTGTLMAGPRLAYWNQATEGPNFAKSQAMPNAMMGRSKEGAYIPLKLTDTCQNWFSSKDFVAPFRPGPIYPADVGQVALPPATYQAFPFPCIEGAHGTSAALGTYVTPSLMNGSVAHLSARNLSNQTSFTFYFRMGIEMQLTSASTLTPQLKLSPPFDRQALDAYFIISRELKDAYPADYNDIGKMWDAIGRAVQMATPALMSLGPYGKAVGTTLNGVRMLGDSIRMTRQERKQMRRNGAGAPSERPPQAFIERFQTARAAGALPTLNDRFAQIQKQQTPRRKQRTPQQERQAFSEIARQAADRAVARASGAQQV